MSTEIYSPVETVDLPICLADRWVGIEVEYRCSWIGDTIRDAAGWFFVFKVAVLLYRLLVVVILVRLDQVFLGGFSSK